MAVDEMQDARLLFHPSQFSVLFHYFGPTKIVEFYDALWRSRDPGGNWLIGHAESPATAAI